MADIDIRVNGEPVKTTSQLAQELGWDQASLRSAIRRAGVEPVEKLDERTPLYRAREVRDALASRPGKGKRAASREENT